MDQKQLVIFLHMAKTGGSTLNQIFKSQYDQGELINHESRERISQRTEQEKKQIKAISGHYIFGIHRDFQQPATYFTMFRDPVDRVVSLYYYLSQLENPPIKGIENMSLKEFVNLDIPPVRNHQLFMCAGNQWNLAFAKKNLNNHFSFIGITEMFNESVFLLKKQLGWGDISYSKQNVTKKRLSAKQISSETLELIRAHNALDLELYSWAKEQFLKQLEALDVNELGEMNQYKESQRRIGS